METLSEVATQLTRFVATVLAPAPTRARSIDDDEETATAHGYLPKFLVRCLLVSRCHAASIDWQDVPLSVIQGMFQISERC